MSENDALRATLLEAEEVLGFFDPTTRGGEIRNKVRREIDRLDGIDAALDRAEGAEKTIRMALTALEQENPERARSILKESWLSRISFWAKRHQSVREATNAGRGS